MNWRFIDSNVLEETESGYVIHLISGTWYKPSEINPVSPPHLTFLKQAQLLRSGLEYVTELCAESTSQTA